MSEVKEAIRALNEISTSDPMKDFWEGIITVILPNCWTKSWQG